jgi:hypothetical protein
MPYKNNKNTSLLEPDLNSFESLINKKNNSIRVTSLGDHVDVYRNLHKNMMFTIKQRRGVNSGIVSGYAKSILIGEPKLIVLEGTRKKVLREKRKHVHAFVRGLFLDAYTLPIDLNTLPHKEVSYNPYFMGSFFYTDTKNAVNLDALPPFILLQGPCIYFLYDEPEILNTA